MNLILALILIVVALVAGAAGGWFIRHSILRRMFNQTRQRSDDLQALQLNYQHEINNLRNKNLEFETEKQKLVKKIEALTGQITESESSGGPRAQSIQSQLAESQQRCEELDAKLREAEVKAETTIKTIQMLQRQNKESRELNEQLTVQIKSFQAQPNESGDYSKLLQGQLDQARAQNQQLSSQVSAFESNHQQLTQRLARQQTELDNVKSELNRVRQNAQSMQQELTKLRQAPVESQASQQEITRLRQSLADAQTALNLAEEAKEDAIRDADELREALEEANRKAGDNQSKMEPYEDNEESVHYSSISTAFDPPSSASNSPAALAKGAASPDGKTPSTSPIHKRERAPETRVKGQRTEKFEPRTPKSENNNRKPKEDLTSTGIRKLEALAEEVRKPKPKKDM